jgi:CO/xanthine dehydrogenase Mo-binding subunit
MDGGRHNASLGDYKPPTAADVPKLETVLVGSGGGLGPHGAKAIANSPSTAPAAIANAVADAAGARPFGAAAHRGKGLSCSQRETGDDETI